jgi:UDP-glucose 4-epimerase
MSTTRTLVLGGSGFIGSHLVPILFSSGRNVTVLGRHRIPRHPVPAGVDYISGDILDSDLVNRLLSRHNEVIHLAFPLTGRSLSEDFSLHLHKILINSLNLFALVASHGAKLVLISSGGSVYGEPRYLPLDEEHSLRPISSYGALKLTIENYAYLYSQSHNLKYVCVRPSNAFGVGQIPFNGQGFIATAIASAISGKPIKIYGKNGATRDYIYVTDVASGILHALQYGQHSETYNLGSGCGLTNADVVDAIRPWINKTCNQIHVEHLPKRHCDVTSNILNSDKLTRDTGWSRLISFTDGIRMTYQWLSTQYPFTVPDN